MASVFCEGMNIEYSIADGAVSGFEYFGKTYRKDGINQNDYSDEVIDVMLAELCERAKWNVNYGDGWRAFVIRLAKLNKLKLYELKEASF